MQNNNAPFKPIMQSQWHFVSIELIQIAGSEIYDIYFSKAHFNESNGKIMMSIKYIK